ncbi:MAG: hypothetical protein R3341_02785 [Methylophaga sp.]|nr:hypothetical protein [Methylophaga sp.]
MEANVIDEKHPAKVAAIFNNEAEAKRAKQDLINEGKFASNLINIVKPEDSDLSKKIEPDNRGIVRTLLNSHIILGIGGLLVGLIAAAILVAIGPAFTQSSPFGTYFAMGFVGSMLGMMLAGAVSLRPDHDPLITKTIEANEHNEWTVIVQTDDREAVNLAKKILKNKSQSVRETI